MLRIRSGKIWFSFEGTTSRIPTGLYRRWKREKAEDSRKVLGFVT